MVPTGLQICCQRSDIGISFKHQSFYVNLSSMFIVPDICPQILRSWNCSLCTVMLSKTWSNARRLTVLSNLMGQGQVFDWVVAHTGCLQVFWDTARGQRTVNYWTQSRGSNFHCFTNTFLEVSYLRSLRSVSVTPQLNLDRWTALQGKHSGSYIVQLCARKWFTWTLLYIFLEQLYPISSCLQCAHFNKPDYLYST